MVTVSWSSMQAYMSCQRKYELSYNENLERRSSTEKRPLILGSAVHAGVQAALEAITRRPDLEQAGLVAVAVNYLNQYIMGSMVEGKLDWTGEPDIAYYTMMKEINETGKKMLHYYLPRLGLGERYTPAYFDGKPIIEFEMKAMLVPGKVDLTGVVDAVLVDNQDGSLVLVDWKCRANLLDADLACMDGQLMTYAAILEKKYGIIVDRLLMVQFRTQTPKPAVMTAGGKPSMVAQISTWEEWLRTLPEPWKAKNFEAEIKPKLHPESDFLGIVDIPVTRESKVEAWKMAIDIARSIAFSQLNDNFPAVYNPHTCQYCEFKKLCQMHRYGGAVDDLLNLEYQKKDLDKVPKTVII